MGRAGQGRARQGRREAGGQEEQGHIHRWAAEMLPHKRLKRADGVRKLQQRPGQGSSATRDIGFSGQASLRRTNRRVTWTNSCHATRQGGGQSPVGWTWGRRKCGHVSGILSPGPKTAGGGQTTRHVCLHSPRRKEWLRDHTPPPDTSSRAPSPLLALLAAAGHRGPSHAQCCCRGQASGSGGHSPASRAPQAECRDLCAGRAWLQPKGSPEDQSALVPT